MVEKLAPLPGTKPLMISMREMDTLGLKTGPGLKDTIDFKLFEKQAVLDEIAQVGFMCPFHAIRADIAKLECAELLLVADRDEVYGENWFVCVRQAAYDAQMALISERLAAAEAAAESKDVDEKPSADELLEMIQYEDKPFVAHPWVSSTSDETHDQVRALTVRAARPVISMSITRRTEEFNADYKFSDRDADQCFVECRQHKDPNYDLSRAEQDIGLQGIPDLVENATQTSWFRAVNSALQYEPIKAPSEACERELQSSRLQTFLANVLPHMEEALQQNETLDIFLDPLQTILEEETGGQHKTENSIKELRTFTDLIYSKNKMLPSIDWHPKKTGVIAVAASTNASFSKREDATDKVEGSYVLIWNFADLIHPQLMIEAPQDVMAVRFNPTQPGIIAGGLFNGQVCVWDISKAEAQMTKKKQKSSHASEETTKAIPPVKPLHTSYIDLSHRRSVADLVWLPAGMEITNRGHLISTPDTVSHQFLTVAGDGQVCFWDLRFKDPKYRMANHNRIKAEKSQAKANKDAKDTGPVEVLFTPLYSIALTKVDGAGELGLKCIVMEKAKDDQPSSRLYCGTEEGEFLLADWRPHASKDDDGPSSSNNLSEDSVEYVQWACHDHFRTTVSLSRSPFFPHILLTVSEANFHIWNVAGGSSSNTPIFISPFSLAPLMCGCFSPTRPGVLYIGKADGVLEVWDLLDQSHRASFSCSIAACSLTTLEFRQTQVAAPAPAPTVNAANAMGKTQAAPVANAATQAPKQQLLAVGDVNGNLHILEIPRTLSRGSAGERQIIEGYFKREIARVKAVAEYADTAMRAANVIANAASNNGNSTNNNNNNGASTPASTTKPPATADAEDDLFKKMEKEFRQELGIDDKYIEQLMKSKQTN
ncbi:hypothetical protein SPRG_02909 [Saprolegnia parasitica CBS 223.65]|uniref:WD repeat-containing protein 63 n=1 Tax=Saprolegnia parasitica (strain CBS 223.65) TaxID=695850 RepID=A0A067CPJ2_SAPPC|nr:hypothetical protein SPRG_02909 [Saprolegnia parasitica CBS 223.65]KDO32433.1 hypothetical protein SPRG_02909 [Saprolegnia parasitica CBS 223.65]|eukprot:XP_012196885.1 hypothetical protein SPRG_02909 [Saprolegnia parasitica CBS 223.65]